MPARSTDGSVAQAAIAGATGPNGGATAAGNPGPGVLPAFATPGWLAKNHHLMKADMRKLAAQLREDHPDWPADADGGDAAAFWRTVYALADRWTYFLTLFEERILSTFGRVPAAHPGTGEDRARGACRRCRPGGDRQAVRHRPHPGPAHRCRGEAWRIAGAGSGGIAARDAQTASRISGRRPSRAAA